MFVPGVFPIFLLITFKTVLDFLSHISPLLILFVYLHIDLFLMVILMDISLWSSIILYNPWTIWEKLKNINNLVILSYKLDWFIIRMDYNRVLIIKGSCDRKLKRHPVNQSLQYPTLPIYTERTRNPYTLDIIRKFFFTQIENFLEIFLL